MRILLLLIAAFLTGCGPRLTLISPPLPDDLLVRCDAVIADPLTTGDQYDLARALAQAIGYGKTCKARDDALVNAMKVRETMLESVKQQLEGAGK